MNDTATFQLPTLPAVAFPEAAIARATKRTMDVLGALVGLLLVLPILLVAAIAVRIEGGPGVIFRQTRVGQHGRHFTLYKLRSLKPETGEGDVRWNIDHDSRLGRVGRFIRATAIDELPQLVNVLTGDMSLVGPRPETVEFVHHHREAYHEILSVRPGVFGLSQLAFVAEGRILDEDDPLTHYVTDILPQKVKLDLMYTRERTVALDVRILFWSTIAVLLRRQVAVNRKTGRMNLRRR